MGRMNFLPYIKAVGTGEKLNRDLTKAEIKDALRKILNKTAAPEQISAFLLGWRVKGESFEELKGSIEVFDEFVTPCAVANSIEFGYPYDGKADNPYLFPLTARYLEPFGIQLSLHGDDLQPAKGGITLKEICTHVPLSENIHYFDRSKYFKELHNLTKIRMTLGIRTPFNTLEKLLNISQSDMAVIGAFHKPFIDKYIQLFKDRYKTLVIIKGNEGTPEIFSKCSIFIAKNSTVEEIKVDPKDFGVEYKKSTRPITLEDSIALTANPSEGLWKLARLNAAVLLFLHGKMETIEKGFESLKENSPTK
ncbi:MAG: glycosyl transferase [Sulfurovum sp.]|jgi:anthranilate phosphoribosyltransferase|nr:glycosyl transferase [Sulfurovum sp.]